MKRLCIFCASSDKLPQIYYEETRHFAQLMAANNYRFIYGGGAIGLMGVVASVAIEMNVPITGVIPKFMVNVEWQHPQIKDMRVTNTMSERKQMMIQLADVIVVLPGSTGTLDEMFDAMANKKLGLMWKPIIVLNINHFYDNLKAQFQRMVDEHFMNEKHFSTIYFANSPEEILKYCQTEQIQKRITLLEGAV